jgi:hypothetical protein
MNCSIATFLSMVSNLNSGSYEQIVDFNSASAIMASNPASSSAAGIKERLVFSFTMIWIQLLSLAQSIKMQ